MSKWESFNPNLGERIGPSWRKLEEMVSSTSEVSWGDLVDAMHAESPTLLKATVLNLLYNAKSRGLIEWGPIRDTRYRLVKATRDGVWPKWN